MKEQLCGRFWCSRTKTVIIKTTTNSLFLLLLIALTGCASSARLTRDSLTSCGGLVLEHSDKLVLPGSFKAPVEITIVAKTDSTNLRIGYTADQVIFNWELDRNQLRINGGPADGLHKRGAGNIPTNKFVTIRWIVTPKHEAIYVDNELRFEHDGDYSKIRSPVSVFPAIGSKVTVKSIKVKELSRVGKRNTS